MNETGNAPSDDVTIRPFRRDDTEALVALTIDAFADASMDRMIEQRFGRGAAPWSDVKADTLRRELEEYPEGCFVAEANSKAVGYVSTAVRTLASRGRVANLAVSAAYRSRGIGRRLVLAALEHFRSRGLAHATIEAVVANSVARHLYADLGFHEITRQVHFAMDLRESAE